MDSGDGCTIYCMYLMPLKIVKVKKENVNYVRSWIC